MDHNEEDDIDDKEGDPTYKPGPDMLNFDSDNIDELLDSYNKSIIQCGK